MDQFTEAEQSIIKRYLVLTNVEPQTCDCDCDCGGKTNRGTIERHVMPPYAPASKILTDYKDQALERPIDVISQQVLVVESTDSEDKQYKCIDCRDSGIMYYCDDIWGECVMCSLH